MTRMSDLFIERSDTEESVPLRFPEPTSTWIEGFDANRAEGEDGGYHSLFCGEIWRAPPEDRQRLGRAVRSVLASYRRRLGVSQQAPVLIAGIGKESAAADALGPRTAARILTTDRTMREAGLAAVSAIKTGTVGETGIDTHRHILALAREIGAELIVTVDALTARSGDRLGTVVQITDCGITPGSALGHASGEISRRTMPCPVLSVGVPTVVRSDVLTGETEDDPMFVTRADTDAMVTCYASILASAINAVFTGNAGD